MSGAPPIPWMMRHHLAGRVRGIRVYLTYSLYLFLGVVVLSQALAGAPWRRVLLLCAALAAYPVFSLAHELAHALVAKSFGVQVQSILIHPLGGMAALVGYPPEPRAEYRIALAGPLTSVLLALGLYPGLLLSGYANPFAALHAPEPTAAPIAAVLVLINLAIGLFNLLPVFPMDGGRAAAAWAIERWGPEHGVRVTLWTARAGVAGLILLGGALIQFQQQRAGITLILIGTFLYSVGHQELQARLLAGRLKVTPNATETPASATPTPESVSPEETTATSTEPIEAQPPTAEDAP